MKELEELAVEKFRTYLRINTMQPTPDYVAAMAFLREYAGELGLPFDEVEVHPDHPLGVMKWTGSEPELPTVVLSSHTDVVPVFREHWKYDPFSAEMDADGNIFARGSQDMKCVGIQYLEAARRLIRAGHKPKRTVYLIFTPDEELGSHRGVIKFIEHDYFKKMNVGFIMDEGLASPGEEYPVYYGERCTWWPKFTITGNPGHGSGLIENSAGERLRRIINHMYNLRDIAVKELKDDPKLLIGQTLTCNLTQIEGGVQQNVVPAVISVTFDVRIPPTRDLEAFDKELQDLAKANGATIGFKQKGMVKTITSTAPDYPWWAAFSGVCERRKMRVIPQIFPAGTDARFMRGLGLPALGFSPMHRTPVLLHDHNEFLNRDVFLKGVEFYEDLIPALSAVAAF